VVDLREACHLAPPHPPVAEKRCTARRGGNGRRVACGARPARCRCYRLDAAVSASPRVQFGWAWRFERHEQLSP